MWPGRHRDRPLRAGQGRRLRGRGAAADDGAVNDEPRRLGVGRLAVLMRTAVHVVSLPDVSPGRALGLRDLREVLSRTHALRSSILLQRVPTARLSGACYRWVTRDTSVTRSLAVGRWTGAADS